MPATVYTERLLAIPASKTSASYTIPVGHRAVLTCIVAINTLAAAHVAWVRIAGTYIWLDTSLAAGKCAVVNLRATAYAGELVDALVDQMGVTLAVTGYLFADDTGRVGPP